MSSNGTPVYDVRHLPDVTKSISDASKMAAARGQKAEFVAALKAVLAKLQTEPSVWGDPEYNLNTPGACVYHGIVKPIYVRYAVFEHGKMVLLMKAQFVSTDMSE